MRVALVTGASRGLGWETCKVLAEKGHHVFVGSRDAKLVSKQIETIGKTSGRLEALQMDFKNPHLETELVQFFKSRSLGLDILINNAGQFPGLGGSPNTLSEIRDTFEVNTLSAFRLCDTFVPLMIQRGYGRVVNVSSGMGQLSEMDAGYPAYRLSKTALNAVTRVFSASAKSSNVLVNSVCPGWVRTEMGGSNAPRTVNQGASGIVWAATLPDGSPSGGFFRDGQPLAW